MTGPFPLKWRYFGALGYRPRVAQRAYHKAADTYRYLGFFAYPRAGKSESAAKEVGATWMYADHRCWIVAPTYDLGSKEFGAIWKDHGAMGLLPTAKKRAFDIRGGNMEIEYPNGWFVRVRTTENPLTLLADELNEIILAEGSQVPQSVWERYLQARLDKRHGRLHIPTTPKGRNWLYEEFYLPGQPTLDGQPNPRHDKIVWAKTVSHLYGQTIGGHVMPAVGDIAQGGVHADDAILRYYLKRVPDVFLEQYGGQFVSYSGLVYKSVRRDRHGCAPFVIPPEWDVIVAIDAGAGADATAIPFLAWDRQRPPHLWLWSLIYEHGKSVQFYADAIKARLGGRRPYAIVRDPSEKQLGIDLSLSHGLGTVIPHSRQFQDRYVALTSLIESDRFHVFLTPELEPWWAEVQSYAWKEGHKGEIRYDAVTGADHAMDATGYAAMVPGPWQEEVVRDPLADTERAAQGLRPLDSTERHLWTAWERERAIHQERWVSGDEMAEPEIAAFAEEEEMAEVWG